MRLAVPLVSVTSISFPVEYRNVRHVLITNKHKSALLDAGSNFKSYDPTIFVFFSKTDPNQ